MVGQQLAQHRSLRHAALRVLELAAQPAAGMEAAAGRRVGRRRDVADQDQAPALGLDRRIGDRHRADQGGRVRVQRIAVELERRGLLDHLAQVHDRDPVADVAHHAQVVRDEQVGQPELLLQLREQVDDLGLDRDIQRRDRLVGRDELRLDGQGPRDAGALPLAAAELVRVAPHRILRQADHLDQLVHAPGALRALGQAVHAQGLGQHGADGHPRIQGGVRILEDHLHPAPHASQRGAEHAHDLLAVELDAPLGHADQPDHRPREGRLAAARFAHQAHRLATAHVKGHAVDGTHIGDVALEDHSFLDWEVDLQVANLEQRRLRCRLRGHGRLGLHHRVGHAPAPAAKPDGTSFSPSAG